MLVGDGSRAGAFEVEMVSAGSAGRAASPDAEVVRAGTQGVDESEVVDFPVAVIGIDVIPAGIVE